MEPEKLRNYEMSVKLGEEIWELVKNKIILKKRPLENS
jgi:hypothetical protein